MFRKGKTLLRTELCISLVCLDKFQVTRKIVLVANVKCQVKFYESVRN